MAFDNYIGHTFIFPGALAWDGSTFTFLTTHSEQLFFQEDWANAYHPEAGAILRPVARIGVLLNDCMDLWGSFLDCLKGKPKRF